MITPPNVRIDNASGLNNSIISVAQQAYYFYANQLDLGGIFSSQKVIEVDGYEIILNINKDFNYGFISGVADIVSPILIKKNDKICSIYMESGFFDLINVGKCTEGAYFPATLNYDADIIEYIDLVDLPLQGGVSILGDELGGEKILDGSVSNSLSCLEKLDTIMDPCGNQYTGGGYCPDLWRLKDVQKVMPSSMFSGKLRLFVQSIYGSARTDYEREAFTLNIGDKDNLEEMEDYPVFNLPRGFTGSSWLYTTSNYDYFLCTRNQTIVVFTPLELTPCAIEFRDILIANPEWSFEEKKRVEGYILAYARPTTKGKMIVNIDGDDIIGSPLDYGWHSTWDGSKATAVCFYDDPVATQYLSDQHQLSVGEIVNEDGTYTFTISNVRLQSDKPWWPWTNGLQVFYYNEEEASMFPVEYPAIIFGGFEGTFDSPIYSYYKLDETSGVSNLITVNAHMDLSTPSNLNFDITNDKAFSNASNIIVNKKNYSGPSGAKGFRVNEDSIDIDVSSLSSSEDRTVTLKSTSGLSSTSGLFFGRRGDSNIISDHPTIKSPNDFIISEGHAIGDTRVIDEGGPGEHTEYLCFMHYHFVWRTDRIVEDDGVSITGQLFMQTVLGDCSNIVTGKLQTSAHGIKAISASTRIDKAIGGKLYWSIENPSSNLSPVVTQTIGEMPGPNYVHLLDTYTDNINPGPFTSSSIPADPGTIMVELFEYSNGTATSVVITDDSILDEYFTPTISDKPTHTTDTSRSSIGNKNKITHSAFNKDGGFINDSSIGWA